jgi:hypothetical protein
MTALILDFVNGFQNEDMKHNLKPGTQSILLLTFQKRSFSAKIKFYLLLTEMLEIIFLLILLFVGHMRIGKTASIPY